jgi:aspartyl-tRNA(Asn)/glutamyl-tRNA(Gln) amidotransferase subunit C
MAITIKDVEHVAKLARLEFDQAHKEQLVKDLNAMLAYIDKLNEVDTTNVEPLAQVGSAANALRPDEVRPSPSQDDMMGNAPDRAGSLFKVPKVIGER